MKKIISILGAAAIAASVGAAGAYAESGYYRYTAAYDDDGRLVAAYKTEDMNPADNTLNFKYLKSFVWDGENEPYAGNNSVVFNTDMYRCIRESDSTWCELQVYDDESRDEYTTYKVDADAWLYVNDLEVLFEFGATDNVFELFEGPYVAGNMIGSVKLIDTPDSDTGETDGIYDVVRVSYYVDGVVDEVEKKTGETLIYFDACDYTITRGEIALDDTVEYSIKLDGAEITPEEIMPGDVLSIAYDVTNRFRDSDAYDIYVSRNRPTVKIESVYVDSNSDLYNKYTGDDGKKYRIAYENAVRLEAGVTYELYLDVDGKIAYAAEKAMEKKYGLLENVYLTNGGSDAYADIITSSGGRTTYEISMNDFRDFVYTLMRDEDAFDTDDKLANRRPPEERVIEYNIAEDGSLRLKEISAPSSIKGEFKNTTCKLAGKQLSPDFTVILDISEYDFNRVNSGTVMGTDGLRKKVLYSGYIYGKSGQGIYPFVLIEGKTETEDPGEPVEDTDPWGVFGYYSVVETANGSCDAIVAYVDQELVILPTDGSIRDDMSPGDLFLYNMNSDGEINEVMMIAKMESTYRDYYGKAMNSNFNMINPYTAYINDKYEFISGAITNVDSDSIGFATERELQRYNQAMDYFSLDNVKEYEFAPDMNVYVYDYSVSRTKDRVSVALKSHIMQSSFERDSYVGDKSDRIVNFWTEWDVILSANSKNYGNVNFAVAKVVDRDITEILVIIPDVDDDDM